MRSQLGWLKGVGDFSQITREPAANAAPFPQATAESMGTDAFFAKFTNYPLADMLQRKDVLDFGCGYGGKAVDYALKHRARRVCGVEPHAHVIEKCRQYAISRGLGAAEVSFEVCLQQEIPYPDNSFDVVLSHDVLEHVDDPRVSLAEIRRVLRPGGLSFNVFPVYFGACSHHLDYISKMPALHWMFSPATLVAAVNSILREHPHIMAQQPEPKVAFDGSRDVLPGLNGLSGEHFAALFRDFDVVAMWRRPLAGLPWSRVTGRICRTRSLPMILRDAATASVACILRKPRAKMATTP
jgi:SAM-dependent methyltransferase